MMRKNITRIITSIMARFLIVTDIQKGSEVILKSLKKKGNYCY